MAHFRDMQVSFSTSLYMSCVYCPIGAASAVPTNLLGLNYLPTSQIYIY